MSIFGPIDWQRAIDMVIILLIAIDVHELAHAIAAHLLGDDTPRRLGELSLNPFVHMDQVGVILLILTSISSFGFTYGRTHVTPANLRFGPQRGNALVAIVGPLSNLLLAGIAGLALSASLHGVLNVSMEVQRFLYLATALNILLFVLNLIPIPPLDGFSILGGFLSARQMYSLAPLRQWGPLILLVLLLTDPQTGIVSGIINPTMSRLFPILCPNC